MLEDAKGEVLKNNSKMQITVHYFRANAGHDLCGVLSHILAAASRTWTDERATAYADRLVHSAEEEGRVNRIGSLNGILSTSRAVDIDSDGTDEAIGLDYNDALLYTIARFPLIMFIHTENTFMHLIFMIKCIKIF